MTVVTGAERAGNMDIAQRERLLAQLGHGYVVYSKQDKHVGYKNVKAIASRGVGMIIGLPKQCPMIVKCLKDSPINLFITDEVKCLTSMIATKVLNDTPSFAAMQKLADMAKRLLFLDADFFLGNQPLDFCHFLLMGREGKRDRLVIYKFSQVKTQLLREIALFHKSVPSSVEAAWLAKFNARMQASGKPAVTTCGTEDAFLHLLSAIKVFMRSRAGRAFKVFVTSSSRARANREASDALRAQLKATAYTTNTDAQRTNDEMAVIDEFFNAMQFITASSTLDVGIDTLVHFPFIIAITKGGTSMPSSHIQAMYRVSRILKMDFTVLWYVDEPMPSPDKQLSTPNATLAVDAMAGKAAFHAAAGTGAPPMHPKLVAIWTDNCRETQWNNREHAVLVRETLKLNPCYRMVEPCDIKMPDAVFAVTPRDVQAMTEAYIDVNPASIGDLFAHARDVALEVSDPLTRHKHSLDHFKGCVAHITLTNPMISASSAESVVLSNCSGVVENLLADADLAKLDAPTLESALLDTWKVVRFTGLLGVDECVVAEMEKVIDRYVLGVASLKGSLAVEHYQMSLQLLGAPKGRGTSVTLYHDIANKVRFAERAVDLLRVPQLIPASAEHILQLPEVLVNRINRLLLFEAIPADSVWMQELEACTRGVSDRNAVRSWPEHQVLSMLATLFSEVGNCEMVTTARPLTQEQQDALTAMMLRREGLDAEEITAATAASTPQPGPDSTNPESLFTMEDGAPPPASQDQIAKGNRRLEIIKAASKVTHLLSIGIALKAFEYTQSGGKVAKGATRVVQENDVGERRTVLSVEKEEQRKRRNAKSQRHSAKRRAGGDSGSANPTTQDAPTPMPTVDAATEIDTLDMLELERGKANAYNAQLLGADVDPDVAEDDGASLSGLSVSTAAGDVSAEDATREQRRKDAKMEALAARNTAAEGEVAEFKGAPDYEAKLAAAKRRLKAEFEPMQVVANFDDDAHTVKKVWPLLLMKWTSTLTCKRESPFSASTLLDAKGKQVVMKSLLSGYCDTPTHEALDDTFNAEDGNETGDMHLAPQPGQTLRAHTLADGYEAGFELYPLQKLLQLLATAKGCTDKTVDAKQLFQKIISMPVKTRTDYETAKIINALERLVAKGSADIASNTLRVPVTYRPGNKIVGVSRSYASYPSLQNIPNVLRIAIMGPHLHDMDIAIALPTTVVIGLIMLGKEPSMEWPTGMAYVEDRRNGIAAGKDEKLFQQAIVTHYGGRLSVDDAKEMINIATNNGKFEWYLQRDHGIRTEAHSPTLINMRKETLHVRDNIFLPHGDAIFGMGNYATLKTQVFKQRAFSPDAALYTAGSLVGDEEKGKRTMFALGLHTIERKVMRVCVETAREMDLVTYSSIFRRPPDHPPTRGGLGWQAPSLPPRVPRPPPRQVQHARVRRRKAILPDGRGPSRRRQHGRRGWRRGSSRPTGGGVWEAAPACIHIGVNGERRP